MSDQPADRPSVDEQILGAHKEFSEYMLRLMRSHAHRKGASWKLFANGALFSLLEHELEELRVELCACDPSLDRIMDECGDLANHCMMIFDNAYRYQQRLRALSEGVCLDDHS